MNEVCILNIIKERTDVYAEVESSVYQNMDSALRAYNVAVDDARTEAKDWYSPYEDEFATDSYRQFRILESNGGNALTIEVQTKEIIGEEPDDI